MNQRINNSKLYTLSVPPNPEDPILHPVRHAQIINCFETGGTACFTMNSEGEVDFYVLLFPEDNLSEFPNNQEQFELNLNKIRYLELMLNYEEEKTAYLLSFDRNNAMDLHILDWLVQEERVNIYFINYFEGEYICIGYKVTELPKELTYDLERYLQGKRSLLLPRFDESFISDINITRDWLLRKAWGFYLDYTAMVNRIGTINDTEEIVSRHILDAIACLQQNGGKRNKKDYLIMWIGRKIRLSENNKPVEFYCLYLSGDSITNDKQDTIKKIMEESLQEIPEYRESLWVSPLAEESIPLVAIKSDIICRFNLTNNFYYLSDVLFKQYYSQDKDYASYYNKILNYSKKTLESKVSSLVKKRKDRNRILGEKLTPGEIMNLVKWGSEEDLALIIENIEELDKDSLDEAIYVLSKRYKISVEPYFLSLMNTPSDELKGSAIIGLGLIESIKSIPLLADVLRGDEKEAAMALDAFSMIGDPAVPYLAALLKEKHTNLRLRAVKALGLIGTQKALELLNDMCKDKSIRVEKLKKTILAEKYENQS
jgi:hypothetical protein